MSIINLLIYAKTQFLFSRQMIHPKEWEIYTAAKELCLKELPFDHLLDPIVPLQKAAPKGCNVKDCIEQTNLFDLIP